MASIFAQLQMVSAPLHSPCPGFEILDDDLARSNLFHTMDGKDFCHPQSL